MSTSRFPIFDWLILETIFQEFGDGDGRQILILTDASPLPAPPRPSCFGRRAGHGGSVKDTSGDEADGMDETLVPVDYQQSGQITDDEILKEVGHNQCRLVSLVALIE